MADSSELDGQASEEHISSSSPRPLGPQTLSANNSMNSGSSPLQDQDGTVGGDFIGPSPRKMRSPRRRVTAGADNQSTDTKSSVVSGDSGSYPIISPKHKDPDRIKKDREREERVQQARRRLEEERKRKLVDLQQQQRQAQENREKQLEMRRRKIEDLRRRDVERRAEVEKRRRDRENAERSRRETLLMKAEERVARYEAWKRSGQKALNAIPEGRRSVLAPSALPPSRPKSAVTLSVSSSSSSPAQVRMRENWASRKPRPASVGTSMPSFVTLEPPKCTSYSQRSKSSDRLARERSRPRGPSSARRSEEKEENRKPSEKGGVKMSRRTLERLSTPRQMASVMGDKGKESAASTPRRETNVARKSTPRDKTPKESPGKGQKPKTGTPSSTTTTTTTTTDDDALDSVGPSVPAWHTPDRVASPTPGADEDGGSIAPPPPPPQPPQARPTPSGSSTAAGGGVGVEKEKPAPSGGAGGDISAEEYKARLAEKRRQAREKAEREAEEERKRQDELQRQEEERQRQEEEEQQRQDEEAMKMAQEARMAEEERLQKAIQAEEARRAEEAARLEQERIAKEEAERKAKEEAERLELEKQEKARRDEEERLERKKRLEMIMKRVKTEGPGEGTKDTKSVTSSPSKSVNSTASSDTSPTEPDNKTVMAMAAAQNDMAAKRLSPAQSLEDSEVQERGANGEEESQRTAASSDQETAPTNGTVHETAAGTSDKPGVAEREEPVGVSSSPVSSLPSSPAHHQSSEGGGDKPKFRSPLLQKLVEGKEDGGSPLAGSGPRFKSPLLQSLLGKTKTRSMGLTQDQSLSDPNLSHTEGAGDSGAQGNGEPNTTPHAASLGDMMTSSMVDMGMGDSCGKESMNSTEEKEVDTSEEDSSSSPSSPPGRGKNIVSNGSDNNNDDDDDDSVLEVSAPGHEDEGSAVVQAEPMEISTTPMMESLSSTAAVPPALMAGSSTSFWSGPQDSGVSFGSDDLHSSSVVAPSSQVSLNGHGLISHLVHSQGLEDSSISMQSATGESSVTSSCITDSAAGSSVFSSVTSLPPGQGPFLSSTLGGDRDFEEFIDLSNVNNKSTTSPTTTAGLPLMLDNSQDLVNFNKLVTGEGSEETTAVGVPPPAPIIAFEDHRQDVSDILS